MSSMVVRFPDGSREFRFPEKALQEGDLIWHDGARYRVLSVTSDDAGRAVVTVEPQSDDLGDLLRSEEGSVRLVAIE
jgi:hypothetical protein